jgi:rubrerythrin
MQQSINLKICSTFILHTAQSHLEDEYDEPIEAEIYAQMERLAQEDLLPDIAELFKAQARN